MRRIKQFIVAMIVFTLSLELIPITEAQASCIHNWGEWKVWVEATCSTEGYEDRTCQKCYETESRNIPATGVHVWTEWKANGELCTNGTYERHCKECYKEETKERIGNGNHLYSKWTILRNPDCVNSGKKYRYCYKCYENFYEEISPSPNSHNWGIWQINYLKNKRIERTCYSCGKVEIKKVTIYPNKKKIKKGKSFIIKIRKHVSDDKVVKYTSSNKKVATVNKKGKVTAKKKGKAKITVKMKSGCKATCMVTVK